MANRFVDKQNVKREQTTGVQFILAHEVFGPHIGFNSNNGASAGLLLDRETIKGLRDWCEQVLKG